MLDPTDDLAAVCAELDEAVELFARRERISIVLSRTFPRCTGPRWHHWSRGGALHPAAQPAGGEPAAGFRHVRRVRANAPRQSDPQELAPQVPCGRYAARPDHAGGEKRDHTRRGGCPARALRPGGAARGGAFRGLHAGVLSDAGPADARAHALFHLAAGGEDRRVQFLHGP